MNHPTTQTVECVMLILLSAYPHKIIMANDVKQNCRVIQKSLSEITPDTIGLINSRYEHAYVLIDIESIKDRLSYSKILNLINKLLINTTVYVIHSGQLQLTDIENILKIRDSVHTTSNLSIKLIHEQQILEKNQHFKHGYGNIELVINWNSIPEAQFDSDSMIYFPKDLPTEVYKYRIIDEKYWYWDEKGSALWLYLKEAKNYRFFTETYTLLEENLGRIINRILRESKIDIEERYIDLVVLGVGSAEKEIHILHYLASKLPHLKGYKELPVKMYYIPIDVSFPLLQNTIRIALSEPSLKELMIKNKLIINPILADFLALPPDLIPYRGNIRFFVALGVLVNIPENDFFEKVYELMNYNDYLLLDTELIGNRDDEQLKKSYLSPENYDFVYHPLELLYRLGEKSDREFEIRTPRGAKIISSKEFISYKLNSYAENFLVEVIEDNDTERLRNSLKNRGYSNRVIRDFLKSLSRVTEKIRFSDLKNSKTVVTLFTPTDHTKSPILLGYSTKYELEELREYIQEKGFNILSEYLNKDRTFCYFLLKKR